MSEFVLSLPKAYEYVKITTSLQKKGQFIFAWLAHNSLRILLI